jgi:hypothetical protein
MRKESEGDTDVVVDEAPSPLLGTRRLVHYQRQSEPTWHCWRTNLHVPYDRFSG